MKPEELSIDCLGQPSIPSPLAIISGRKYIGNDSKILYNPHFGSNQVQTEEQRSLGFELAGPREKLFFDPKKAKVAIVTCGGLCPGINTVIRNLVNHLWQLYGCQNIVGIKYGFNGLKPEPIEKTVKLTPKVVNHIDADGGSYLGCSRGTPPKEEIVERLITLGIDVLFVIGGDGTMRGAFQIYSEIKKRGLAIGIVGIPKTIDNDIPYVKRSFGFSTAVAQAADVIRAAHVEASALMRGIGLVKLMGRHAGYIAANACLSSGHVDFCLVPEISFRLEGEGGLLDLVGRVLDKKSSAIIVVAEGAGQEYFYTSAKQRDASGNEVLHDIGYYLKNLLKKHFSHLTPAVSIKYIDPGYIIRSAPANSTDQLFCARFAHNAVHAAFAGKTGLMIGYWHGRMTHVPLEIVCGKNQLIDPTGDLWFNVLETTGQPVNI